MNGGKLTISMKTAVPLALVLVIVSASFGGAAAYAGLRNDVQTGQSERTVILERLNDIDSQISMLQSSNNMEFRDIEHRLTVMETTIKNGGCN